MWRLGNLTHDLFDDIDFLGTHRSYTFLEYCEPLDEANLRIKIHKYLDPVRRPSTEKKIAENSDNWEESRPKVGAPSLSSHS